MYRRWINLNGILINYQTLCSLTALEIDWERVSCFLSRDEAQAKMILLKERADKDQQQHNAEMKELLRIIDHERNLREFMGIKGQERVDDPQLVAWRQKKGKRLEISSWIPVHATEYM